MTGSDPERLLRHATQRDAFPTAGCLDDDTIAALAEGTLDDIGRAAAFRHLAECPRCRSIVASVAKLLGDPAVGREITALRGGRRRLLRLAISAAAAAIVLLVAMPSRRADVPPHRAPTITAVSSPIPLSPAGIVAGADILRWSSVNGADRYRTTLFDDAGTVVYEIQTGDTVIALPSSIQLTPRRSYLWKVEARTGWGRWSASELVEFSVR